MSKGDAFFQQLNKGMSWLGKWIWREVQCLWAGMVRLVGWTRMQLRGLWLRFLHWAFRSLYLEQSQAVFLRFPEGDWRQDVLNDFASWLAQIDVSVPSQPPVDLSHDLLEVLTELSAVRQEIKRQSREQSKLNEELTQMEGIYRELGSQFESKFKELEALRQGVKHDTEKSVFLLFADIRDAIRRGISEIEMNSQKKKFTWKAPPGWEDHQEGYETALARLQGYETALSRFKDGYEMVLARFDQTLTHLGILKVPTRGRPFDPRFMVAIATRREPGVEAGTVLEEAMSGYVRGEEVIRLAQVVVAVDAIEQ